MTKFGLWVSLWVGAVWPVCAQVSVEVMQEQEQFLPGEALPTAVRIINHSGQTLHLGAEPDWLTFSIESLDGPPVVKTGEVPVVEPFVLDSSKMATKRVDLAPYFTFSQQGRYAVIATVRIRSWDRVLTSPPKNFDLIEGARLWEQDFGVPVTNAPPEVRKYILQEANYLRGQLRLYLRLTDASGARTFRVFPIGSMVSFSRPDPQLDRWSNLHLLYQNGPRSFSYTVFNPQGEMVVRQTYEYTDTRPRLKVNEEGTISVVGGVRRPMKNDLPPPSPTAPPEDTPKTTAPPETGKPPKP